MYKDPEHKRRSQDIDTFKLAFEQRDRDPERLLMDLKSLQNYCQYLDHIQHGYEANLDRLSQDGRDELFKIRSDLLERKEHLFTVFEAIATNFAKEDARAAIKSATRFDVRAGSIAWHMLESGMQPLMKLDIEGAVYSHLKNRNGTVDSAAAIKDLKALNHKPNAAFHEVLVRYEPTRPVTVCDSDHVAIC